MKKTFLIFLCFICVIGNSLTVVNAQNNVNKNERFGLVQLEEPADNQESSGIILIKGYALSDFENQSLQIYVDDQVVSEDVERFSRSDIDVASLGYSVELNKEVGFQYHFDTSNLQNGEHTIKVGLSNSDSIIMSNLKTILIENVPIPDEYQSEGEISVFSVMPASDNTPRSMTYIDNPSDNQKVNGSISVTGWSVSTEANSNIQVRVDGTRVSANIIRTIRKDVIDNVANQYGGANVNKTPGYEVSLDMSNYRSGTHTIVVETIDRNGNLLSNASKKVYIEKANSIAWIDDAKVKTDDVSTLTVSGWAMSEEKTSRIQLSIDGTIVTEDANRTERKDVLNNVKGYGNASTTPNPGFYASLDISKFSTGNHTLYAKVISKSGEVLAETSRPFVKNKSNTLTWIDSPTQGGNVLNEMTISGWAMSTDKTAVVQILVDGNVWVDKANRSTRNDVLKSVKGYGDSATTPKPGYSSTVDVSGLGVGQHKLTVRTLSANQEVLTSEDRTFSIRNSSSMTWIDAIKVGDSDVNVSGWAMSENKNTKVSVYIDNQLYVDNANRLSRDDVLKSVNGYGNSTTTPKPGFQQTVGTENLKSGEHNLKIKLTAANGTVLAESNMNFTKKKVSSTMFIDSPNNNATVKDSLVISGWSMSAEKNSIISVYIDGVLKENSALRTDRGDVLSNVHGYGNSTTTPKPGFYSKLDVNNLTSGNHIVTVKTMSQAGEVLSEGSIRITKAKSKGITWLDTPTNGTNAKGNLVVSGWAMSEDRNAVVQLIIDDKNVNGALSRVSRNDVLSSVNGYGDKTTTPNPGFYGEYNLDYLAGGQHKVEVRLVSQAGEVLATSTSYINVNNAVMKGIDVSEHNGTINWDEVKASGIQFAIIRVGWGHFVEDAQYRRNVSECERLNIPYGLYHYSYALNMDEARQEADGLINAIQGTHPSLPVFIDMEDADGYKSRNGMPSDYILQSICSYTSDRLTQSGYRAGIYASLNWFNTKLNSSSLDYYEKWVAQWNDKCDYTKPYILWQYTSDGSVPGINGRVDMNYAYPGIVR